MPSAYQNPCQKLIIESLLRRGNFFSEGDNYINKLIKIEKLKKSDK